MSTRTTPPASPAPRTAGVGKGSAVWIEIVSVVAALGFGHLVAGFVAPASSPYLAVADTVIRLSPEWLVEFGKTIEFPALGLEKGVADKVLLLIGIGVVILVIAAAAGAAAGRHPSVGRAVIAVLGIIGLAAVIFSPVFAPLNVLAPLVALGVGLAAFGLLYSIATRADVSAAGSGPDASRRGLLLSTVAVGLGGVVAGAVGYVFGGGNLSRSRQAVAGRIVPDNPAPPIPPGADFVRSGTPTFITPNAEFYRIDVALRIPTQAASDWSMRIHGMVDNEIRLTFDELLSRPLLEKTITMTCVSNEVNGNLISTSNFIGISLRDLLTEAGVRPGADQIFTTSIDGWTCGTPTDAVMQSDDDALLAIGMNGEPLPPEHGFPVRMVVPGLYGYVSATKWIADMELTTFDARQSYWLRRGWAERAPIKTQSRVDRPRGFETLTRGPDGRVTAAGIAWAQERGIERVEVRVDEGPWQLAELAVPVNIETWRMWRINLELSPGTHFLQCRATDRTGYTQTQERVPPIPDGATGWPGISFNVR